MSNSPLFKQITVESITASRYRDHKRPRAWTDRKEGIDVVRAGDGLTYRLVSEGGQSPPQVGWSIVLTGGDPKNGYSWTLFSMPQVVRH